MLALTGVTKRFGPLTILDSVDLTLATGRSLALVGESGSGKSTLLHLIAGLDRPDAGRIMVAGAEVQTLSDADRAALRRDRIGLVFQQFNLVQSLTVAQNIALQARLAGHHDPGRDAHLVDRLGLGGLERRYPEQLSGGQQQRVAIARALAAKPPLLLADEPTGNLDEASGDAVLDLMLDLVAEAGTTLVMVTHSPRLAARLDTTLQLQAGRLA
ncbi:MAG: ABC transporter ATP-binding protein [Pseudomonadota bacterium]